MSKRKSAAEEKKELIEKVLSDLNAQIAKIDNKKLWFGQKHRDIKKAELQAEITELEAMKTALATRRNVKRVSRGIISGVVVDTLLESRVKHWEKKETKNDTKKTNAETAKSGLLTGYGVKKLDRQSAFYGFFKNRATKKKATFTGLQRTILLPKLTRDNHMKMQIARTQGLTDYRKNRLTDIEKIAETAKNNGRYISAVHHSIKAALYKKRVDRAEIWLQRLKDKAKLPKYKGARGYRKAKTMGFVARL